MQAKGCEGPRRFADVPFNRMQAITPIGDVRYSQVLAGWEQIFRDARNKAEEVAALHRSRVTQQRGKDAAACAKRCAE